MMVETLENWAGALRAVANVDQAAYQTYLYEAEQLTPLFNAEEERVSDACR
jgi:hypothetical protein